MIYLDNASTTYPKPENVYTEMDRCLREYCANPGRGGHALSQAAGEAVQQTRETIAHFFNFDDPQRLIFTKNATEALNIAIKGLLNPGEHVITTTLEHNSVVRPLKGLERENSIEITFIQGNEFGEITPSTVSAHIRKNTRLIACTLSSNVTLLDQKYQIATRAGLHCAPLAHQTLGYTVETGVLRFSVGCFNTADEIDYTVNAVREIAG